MKLKIFAWHRFSLTLLKNFFMLAATLYGVGVYFATTSKYSHGYTQPDQQGHRKMFLADVITGEFTRGKPDMKVPPLIPNTIDSYDSVVNNVANPKMHVVFRDASVYPLNILTYT